MRPTAYFNAETLGELPEDFAQRVLDDVGEEHAAQITRAWIIAIAREQPVG